MKKIIFLGLVILIGGGLAYIYIKQPDTWNEIFNKEKHLPVSEKKTTKRTTKPTTTEPNTKRVVMGKLTLAAGLGETYVNGRLWDGGVGEKEVPPGDLVVVSYGENVFSHQVLRVEEGKSYRLNVEAKTVAPTKEWDGFQAGGLRTGFIEARDRDSFSPAWTKELGEKVKASPVMMGGQALFASEDAFLKALDLQSGEVLWSNGSVGSKVTPVANSTHAFAGNAAGTFAACRLKDGREKGSTRLGGYISSLALVSEEAFVAVSRGVLVQSIKTKKNFIGSVPLKVNWEKELPELDGATATPLVVNDVLVFQCPDGALIALAAEDGAEKWRVPGFSGQDENGMELMKSSTMTLSIMDHPEFLTPTPASDGAKIYSAINDNLRAVRVSDGSVLWEKKLPYQVMSSVSLAYDLIYVGGADGNLYAYSALNGTEAFRADLGEKPVFASPVLFKNKLLAGTGEGSVVLLNCFSGRELARDNSLKGSPIYSTPAVSDTHVLVMNLNGKMVCYR